MAHLRSCNLFFALLAYLQSQLELLTKKVEALEAKLAALDLRANDWVRRSCHELFTSNPFLHSGMYWIDPDGQGFGRAPILVHCDMKTGKNKNNNSEIISKDF